jgi:hypothetical protein
MSREAVHGVGEVHSTRMLRGIPQEHMFVCGWEVRGRGHIDRGGFVVWCGGRMVCSVVSRWARSGLCVSAAHDQT